MTVEVLVATLAFKPSAIAVDAATVTAPVVALVIVHVPKFFAPVSVYVVAVAVPLHRMFTLVQVLDEFSVND